MGGGLEPVARSAQAHFSQEPPPLSSTARQWPSALLPYFPTALGTSLRWAAVLKGAFSPAQDRIWSPNLREKKNVGLLRVSTLDRKV